MATFPLAAVTVMVTVLLPERRPVAPLTERVAAASAATAATTTEVVPAATVMLSPGATLVPLTARLSRALLLLSGVT